MPEPKFDSYRSPVLATRGMVATSQPLATQAGPSILIDGGGGAAGPAAPPPPPNPPSPGIGGDCFALYYAAQTQAVTALNGSGRAPAALTIDLIRKQNLAGDDFEIADPFHAHCVTVPGACAGWCDLVERHGTMPMSQALAPAIRLAEEGFPVAPLTSYFWGRGAQRQLKDRGRELTIDGRGPKVGELFRNAGLGRTFRMVAEGGKDAFYRGEIGRKIVGAVQKYGGVMTEDDLAVHTSTWDAPISTTYRGQRVWECPPNGQGLTALIALNILEGFDLASLDPLSPERLHLIIESLRLAFADTRWYVA